MPTETKLVKTEIKEPYKIIQAAYDIITTNDNGEIFEFRSEDIIYVEELSSITKPNGVTIERVRLWVRNGSPAMQMAPVRVGIKEKNC